MTTPITDLAAAVTQIVADLGLGASCHRCGSPFTRRGPTPLITGRPHTVSTCQACSYISIDRA